MAGTSAGSSVAAAATLAEEETDELRDVVMRDRMLLRALYTRSEDLPRLFDEEAARRHAEAMGEDWAERLVVWRGRAKRRIEIYEDYNFPGVAKLRGHKRLAFVIPLNSSSTNLSLYSATDFTFCLTCAPTPAESMTSRAMFHFASTGTNIFILKHKSRTRSIDWMWKLWRHMGGEIPKHVDVKVPGVDTRVRIFVPPLDPLSLTRKEILETCLESLLTVHDYKALMQRALKEGGKAELCWRNELNLDWVWLSADVNGRLRPWEVLNGMVLRQVRKTTHLELRLAEHYPTKVVLANGATLTEPPAIEGYLHRYTVLTSRINRKRVYVATQDGNLMFMPQHRVRPPAPPSLPPDGQTDKQRKSAWAKFRAEDTARQGENILVTDEYIDLRDIHIIRWAETTLSKTEDTKHHLCVKRSFEVVMRSGQVFRLEAHTRKNASEWMNHLKALACYWTRQHHVWARFEMDVTYGVEERRDGVLRPPTAVGWYPRPKEPVDPDAGSTLLPWYWHWCVIDGCRAIIKAGRLFQKTGYRKEFKHVYHILVRGHLMQFQLTRSITSAYRMISSIPLADAYVYSGQSVVATMPPSRDEQQGHFITRYYQDGFEARDSDEDTTFILWYRDTNVDSRPVAKPPEEAIAAAHVEYGADPLPGHIPALKDKNRILICRARSKLERDAWCWALNVEIERVVRGSVARESAVREHGEIIRS
ncbi:hypothetical protein DACRYDRAFT_78267 [Dacryopinax primogenitus]|uniref:PH domain-containing protein n=1 Tax=Dacryopinax primogenitus (strain DJM 731) TaxID=1858805 RepID=M5FZ80_DACPD|nr:uncharacterized protein DACRYDRAFT_78267 [Dacryopinax primogenitus]EJU03351.1 hypothetical protein DACRYDRAFT_78267 [Dacryopinax primogenitus]